MIENAELAADVSRTLQTTFEALGDSIVSVNAGCGEAEASLYREKIGDIFYIIVFGILEPLYEKHPQLKPQDWDAKKS
ncbi:hypothetical protein [Terriglobus saanensis]|uniref:Uncharacterized protein n=1 Tax=Terriglobus saanensis (strain ATCC BAA-1853 / DSM 23119 / SP1PR4) TaxID=401053 RepID=E8V6H9_TERSS|nr:hypothetical protein [Terriglobus saanensis]ADV82718.1 hypothetical protein AciPR4_1913 [Terriglobus saanensis SP1PR4]